MKLATNEVTTHTVRLNLLYVLLLLFMLSKKQFILHDMEQFLT